MTESPRPWPRNTGDEMSVYAFLYPYRAVKIEIPSFLTNDDEILDYAMEQYPWDDPEELDQEPEIHFLDIHEENDRGYQSVRRIGGEDYCKTLASWELDEMKRDHEKLRRKATKLKSQVYYWKAIATKLRQKGKRQ